MFTPDDYDPVADFIATGSVLCDDCGTRVRPRTLESLPQHNCAERARQRREDARANALLDDVFREVNEEG